MEAKVTWMRDGTFVADSHGHSILMDVSADDDARAKGPSPMDMLIIGAAGCTSYDTVQLLKESGEQISDCVVSIKAQLADDHPQTIDELHLQYTITGRGINREKVEEAIRQSQQTYSAALITLGKLSRISTDFRIYDTSN